MQEVIHNQLPASHCVQKKIKINFIVLILRIKPSRFEAQSALSVYTFLYPSWLVQWNPNLDGFWLVMVVFKKVDFISILFPQIFLRISFISIIFILLFENVQFQDREKILSQHLKNLYFTTPLPSKILDHMFSFYIISPP